jgi:hypothetical protein
MSDEEKETLLSALESAANFLRGMCFDPRLHSEIPSACIAKATEIDDIVADFLEGSSDE